MDMPVVANQVIRNEMYVDEKCDAATSRTKCLYSTPGAIHRTKCALKKTFLLLEISNSCENVCVFICVYSWRQQIVLFLYRSRSDYRIIQQ